MLATWLGSQDPRIHSMELKAWACTLQSQGNTHSMLNPFNGIERGRARALRRWRGGVDDESIQWNWKPDNVIVLADSSTYENPFNGIESTHLRTNIRARKPYESIQWNWKIPLLSFNLQLIQHPRIHSMELKVTLTALNSLCNFLRIHSMELKGFSPP